MEFENESFLIILHSGNARSNAYEAMREVKGNNLEVAKKLVADAKAEILIAQKEHAKLLKRFAEGEVTVNLLLVHAEDHVSSTQVAVDLIGEMIVMYERFGG